MKKDYNLHENYVAEQAMSISNDPKERIKNYLENEDLLEEIADYAANLDDDDEIHEIQLKDKNFDILSDDKIFIQADLTNNKDPKFKLWIMNEKIMYGDVDFENAATLLYNAGKGIGTDEDTYVSVAGAIARLAFEKKIDPELLFKKLSESVSNIYGDSLSEWIEEEFSGRAETTALNVFRRKISKDVWRGIAASLSTILSDVGLTVLTFGVGTAGATAFKGTSVGTRAAKSGIKIARGVKGIEHVNKSKLFSGITKIWRGLSPAKKLRTIKAKFPVGSKMGYVTKGGKSIPTTVVKYSDETASITLKGIETGSTFNVPISNLVTKANQAGGMSLKSLSALNITGAFAAQKGAQLAQNYDIPTSQADGLHVGELLGYYDTLAADPTKYLEDLKDQNAKLLANNLYSLKEGSGLFGNTTNQEELAMALLITSLDPEICPKISKHYKKLDPSGTVYGVIDDELEGDMGMFVKAWWTGCTGEGDDFAAKISNIYTAIKK